MGGANIFKLRRQWAWFDAGKKVPTFRIALCKILNDLVEKLWPFKAGNRYGSLHAITLNAVRVFDCFDVGIRGGFLTAHDKTVQRVNVGLRRGNDGVGIR